ncbi:MAG: Gfo/Idh/MocA family protein, partial [Anaerolineae bacterium]
MRNNKTIRWGILSTGSIAHKFAEGLSQLPDAELIAVGSRRQETAEAFGEEHGVPHRHASYEALANNPEVDVIYIGTPHPFHKENSLLALRAGKAVLCEKPLTINAAEAEEIITVARDRGLFLMEAMWTRFIPAVVRVRQLLAEGVIGNIRLFQADFGFRADFDPKSRLFAPKLGGGALLDIGIYPISFASMILGTPTQVTSLAHLGQTGVDEEAAILLSYPNGALAALLAAIRTATPTEATIMGTKGRIKVHSPFLHPHHLTLYSEGKEEIIDIPYEGNGYNYEAAEVGRCLRTGKT